MWLIQHGCEGAIFLRKMGSICFEGVALLVRTSEYLFRVPYATDTYFTEKFAEVCQHSSLVGSDYTPNEKHRESRRAT
jgi:hypothetical protein